MHDRQPADPRVAAENTADRTEIAGVRGAGEVFRAAKDVFRAVKNGFSAEKDVFRASKDVFENNEAVFGGSEAVFRADKDVFRAAEDVSRTSEEVFDVRKAGFDADGESRHATKASVRLQSRGTRDRTDGILVVISDGQRCPAVSWPT